MQDQRAGGSSRSGGPWTHVDQIHQQVHSAMVTARRVLQVPMDPEQADQPMLTYNELMVWRLLMQLLVAIEDWRHHG